MIKINKSEEDMKFIYRLKEENVLLKKELEK
jgi:hypothetical protein